MAYLSEKSPSGPRICCFHRAGVVAQLHLGDHFRLLHPQVDQRHPAVAADDIDIAAGGGHAGDVDGITGVHRVDDLEGVAVNDRHLARVAQRDCEVVLPVALVLRRCGAFLRRHDHLPGLHHLRQRHFGRRGRLVLEELRHHLGLGLGQHALLAPVGHAAWRAVEDDRCQRGRALGQRHVRRQRRAGGALAQRAVAARTPFEEDLFGVGEFGLGKAGAAATVEVVDDAAGEVSAALPGRPAR